MSGLYLVVVIPAFTGISYGGVKGLLSIINSDIHMGIFFKGARRVVINHKSIFNIIT